MTTRSRKKQATQEAEIVVTDPEPETQQSTGILRNAELLAEVKELRAEVALLKERAAASDERAFYTTATLKELQQIYHVDVEEIKQTLQSLSTRLTEIEKKGRHLIKGVRELKYGSQLSQKAAALPTHPLACIPSRDVESDDEADAQSAVSSICRADVMRRQLEDSASDVDSCISHGYVR